MERLNIVFEKHLEGHFTLRIWSLERPVELGEIHPDRIRAALEQLGVAWSVLSEDESG